MNWYGRLICTLLGAALLGPIGAVLGFMMGYYFDQGLSEQGTYRHQHQDQTQAAFFKATFAVMGHIAKADGRVNPQQIKHAEQIMAQMGLNTASRRAAIKLFNLGKQPHFNLYRVVMDLKETCHARQDLLRIFIEIQLQAAYADGALNLQERWIIQFICQQLGFNPAAFNDIHARYQAKQEYQRYTRQADAPNALSSAYQILGVSQTATDAEVKRAYRRLMSHNHPDKLVSKGLPDDMIKVATQKTQTIMAAYKKIQKARQTART